MYKGHKLKHWYHIYSSGLWEVPYEEHLRALTDSGLLDALDFIGVGIVGTEISRDRVKKVLPPQFHVVAEAGAGWEQVTHAAIVEDLQESSKILYAHSKGAANHRHDQDTWRREMTNGTVYHWRECVDLLDQYDAVGCRYRVAPWKHYSGTVYWATSSYISTLAPISSVYRDEAESWIGQSRRGGTHVEIDTLGNVTGVHPFGRTFISRKTISGYSSSELPDIGQAQVGDEFVGFSPMVGNQIITHLIMNGAKCSMIGDTIIVESIS